MSAKFALDLIFYCSGILPGLLFTILSVIQVKRLIQRIKWVYNDWLIITWLISYLCVFVLLIAYIIISLISSKNLNDTRWILYNIMWFFLRMFEVLSMSYPVLLIIYYTKLGDLQKNKPFEEVKRSINRLEVTVIVTISIALLIHLMITTVPNIVIYAYPDWDVFEDWKEDTSKFNDSWKVFNYIRKYALYYYQVFNITLWIIQALVFWHIKKTMKTKLFYYYQRAMKELRILLISHISLLALNTLLNFGFLFVENGYSFYL